MKKKFLILVAAVFSCGFLFSQPGISNKVNFTNINFNTLKMSDLVSGSYKSSSIYDRAVLLASMNNRFKALPRLTIATKQFNALNGLKYYISKDNIQLPANSTGSTTETKTSQDNLICRTATPVGVGKLFNNLTLIPSSATLEYASIYPGAIFKDVDVINGKFTSYNLKRKPGTIAVNIFSGPSNIETVDNFANKNVVNAAIGRLLSRVGNSNAQTDNVQVSFELRASAELSMQLEASTTVDFTQLLQLPVKLGENVGAGTTASIEFNSAIAYVRNINYMISVAGDENSGGPSSTIDQEIPSDAVCVTDVLYGSVAFIIVNNLKTRQETKLVAGNLLSVADVANSENSVSASAKRALETGAVSVMVYGGGGSGSVNKVTSVAQLRNELSKSNSVTGANAQPLFYILRYASDNAPVKIAAFSSFSDIQCFKADKLEINIVQAKLNHNAELDGNEELFGNIRVDFGGNSLSDNRDFWTKSKSSSEKTGQGELLSLDHKTITFNVNPALVNFDEEVITFTTNIKDKIEDGPEWAGTTQKGKDDGYVQYSPKEFKVNLATIRDSPNGTLTKTFKVTEGTSEVEVKVEFKLTP